MEVYEYQTLFQLEDDYWWCRGLRDIILDQVRVLPLTSMPKVLDIGCGSGGTLEALMKRYDADAYAFDCSTHVMPFLKKRGLHHRGQASVNRIPFKDGTFELVFCISVLEHESADPHAALAEMERVLSKEGHVIFVVPAYPWLGGTEHDQAIHATQRYAKGQVQQLFEEAGFKIVRSTYLFPALFPLMAVRRVIEKMFRTQSTCTPRSELKPLPTLVNSIFYGIVCVERVFLKFTNFMFGSSIFVVAQKKVPNRAN